MFLFILGANTMTREQRPLPATRPQDAPEPAWVAWLFYGSLSVAIALVTPLVRMFCSYSW